MPLWDPRSYREMIDGPAADFTINNNTIGLNEREENVAPTEIDDLGSGPLANTPESTETTTIKAEDEWDWTTPSNDFAATSERDLNDPPSYFDEAQRLALREIMAFSLAAIVTTMVFILVWTTLLRWWCGPCRRQERGRTPQLEEGVPDETPAVLRPDTNWLESSAAPNERQRTGRTESPSRRGTRGFATTGRSISGASRRPTPPAEDLVAQIHPFQPDTMRDTSPTSPRNTWEDEPEGLPPFPMVNGLSTRENKTGICNAPFKNANL